MGKERIEDRIVRLANPVAQELGYELVEVEYCKEGPDWFLRFFIDTPQGVGITECQRFSEAVGVLLDNIDPIPRSYLLEVSSPGIERPLIKDADFTRFSGQKVELRLVKPINGQKTYIGELIGLDEKEDQKIIKIKLNGETMEILRSEVAKAHIISEIFGGEGGKKRK